MVGYSLVSLARQLAWWDDRAMRWAVAAVAVSVVLIPSDVWADDESYRSALALELGLTAFSAPMYVDYDPDVICTDSCAQRNHGWGVGPSARVRYAPLIFDHFGVELDARASLGRSPDTRAAFVDTRTSARVQSGLPEFRPYVGYEFGWRALSSSSAAPMSGEGSDEFVVYGPVAGVDMCLGGYRSSPLYCAANLGFEVAFETPEFDVPTSMDPSYANDPETVVVQGGRFPVFRLRFATKSAFVEGSFTRGYPAANPPGVWENEPVHAIGVETDRGTMMGIVFGFTGDVFNDDERGALGRGAQTMLAALEGETSDIEDSVFDSGSDERTARDEDSIDEERSFRLESCGQWKAVEASSGSETLDRWDIEAISRGATFDIRIDSAGGRGKYVGEYGSLKVMELHWRRESGGAEADGERKGPLNKIYDLFERDFRDEFTVAVTDAEADGGWSYEVRCRK